MPSQLFIQRNGKVVGPLSPDTVKHLTSNGEIRETDHISKTPNGPWKTIGDVPALAKLFQSESADNPFDDAQSGLIPTPRKNKTVPEITKQLTRKEAGKQGHSNIVITLLYIGAALVLGTGLVICFQANPIQALLALRLRADRLRELPSRAESRTSTEQREPARSNSSVFGSKESLTTKRTKIKRFKIEAGDVTIVENNQMRGGRNTIKIERNDGAVFKACWNRNKSNESGISLSDVSVTRVSYTDGQRLLTTCVVNYLNGHRH
ncbi:MAG: DUF4339 domain-containing protein [Pirellulaceae bacterium]|nr:DUF4339 domain-containing protein [Pirellulaceae bacterium]